MSLEPGDRLERALGAYLEHVSSHRESDDAFLSRHHELRDLLEPILSNNTDSTPEATMRCLGDFELLRELGRGGMGVVWEARQRSLDRRVAVKVLAPELTASLGAVARLRREATTAARLSHPNLVKMLGLGSEGPVHFLAMDLVEGRPIDAVERTPREIASLLAQVADALEHTHRAGVVHRDVKPANILVRDDGTATLMDFGLARSEDHPGWTRSGAFAGTPEYAAPEQLRGSETNARSDLFALGVTLHELLTGELPFAGATAAAVLEAHRDGPPDPRRRVPTLPAELVAIAGKAMEQLPDDRYETAAALARDLRAYLAGEAVGAQPPSLLTRLGKWVRREPWRAAAMLASAVGILSLGGLAGYWLTTRPLLQEAEQQARISAVESLLAEAFIGLANGAPERSLAGIDRALTLIPDHGDALLMREELRAPSASVTPRSGALIAGMHMLRAEQPSLAVLHDRIYDREGARRTIASISLAARSSSTPRLPLYVLLAVTAGAARDRDLAREAEAVLAARWPQPLVSRWARARALVAYDREAAIALLARCVDEQPDDAGLQFELAILLHVVGRATEAVVHAERLVTLQPETALAHQCLAECLEKAGQSELAMAAYRRTLALEPGRLNADYNLGLLLLDAGQLDAALSHFRRAAELRPQHAQAWNNIGHVLLELGRRDEALPAFHEALRRDPDLEEASGNVLKLAEGTGNWSLMWAELQRCATRVPNGATEQRDVATFLLRRDIAAPFGTPVEALRAAVRAFALSGFNDAESARLAKEAWQFLDDQQRDAAIEELCAPVTR